jgi:hypothetical protein
MDATSGATRPSAISSTFTFLASDTDATDTVAAKVAEAAVEEDEGDSIVGNFFEMMADNIEKKEEEKAKKAVDVDSIAEEAKLNADAAEKVSLHVYAGGIRSDLNVGVCKCEHAVMLKLLTSSSRLTLSPFTPSGQRRYKVGRGEAES